MPAVNLQNSQNLFYTSELRRGNTLEPFKNLAKITAVAEACFFSYLLNGFLRFRQKHFSCLYLTLGDVFHRSAVQGLPEQSAQMLRRNACGFTYGFKTGLFHIVFVNICDRLCHRRGNLYTAFSFRRKTAQFNEKSCTDSPTLTKKTGRLLSLLIIG